MARDPSEGVDEVVSATVQASMHGLDRSGSHLPSVPAPRIGQADHERRGPKIDALTKLA